MCIDIYYIIIGAFTYLKYSVRKQSQEKMSCFTWNIYIYKSPK